MKRTFFLFCFRIKNNINFSFHNFCFETINYFVNFFNKYKKKFIKFSKKQNFFKSKIVIENFIPKYFMDTHTITSQNYYYDDSPSPNSGTNIYEFGQHEEDVSLTITRVTTLFYS